jgi:hypothetical protein
MTLKYLRDWATSKERADLIAELEKPSDPLPFEKRLGAWHPDCDLTLETLGEMLQARTKTKH